MADYQNLIIPKVWNDTNNITAEQAATITRGVSYTKSEIDTKDTASVNSAKSYTDGKFGGVTTSNIEDNTKWGRIGSSDGKVYIDTCKRLKSWIYNSLSFTDTPSSTDKLRLFVQDTEVQDIFRTTPKVLMDSVFVNSTIRSSLKPKIDTLINSESCTIGIPWLTGTRKYYKIATMGAKATNSNLQFLRIQGIESLGKPFDLCIRTRSINDGYQIELYVKGTLSENNNILVTRETDGAYGIWYTQGVEYIPVTLTLMWDKETGGSRAPTIYREPTGTNNYTGTLTDSAVNHIEDYKSEAATLYFETQGRKTITFDIPDAIYSSRNIYRFCIYPISAASLSQTKPLAEGYMDTKNKRIYLFSSSNVTLSYTGTQSLTITSTVSVGRK